MTLDLTHTTLNHIHDWLRPANVYFAPKVSNAVLDTVMAGLADQFRAQGHTVQSQADASTTLAITTAPFGEPLGWRESLLYAGRRHLRIKHAPTILTLIHVTPDALHRALTHLENAIAKDPIDPADFAFPGLAPDAYRTLVEQGRRGGPLMALVRLLQAQSKSIRILLVVGDDRPQCAYLFDLVGAFPRIDADAPHFFYRDLVLRIATALSTFEITQHEALSEIVPRSLWDAATAPKAMLIASQQLGRRNFFTETVRVANLIHAPAIADRVAEQYSEGCFATWDTSLNGLVATITGSARPVDKGNITEDELALIVGVRPDGMGAIVRHVENKRNDKPSSEAVEMMDMDEQLPTIELGAEWDGVAAARVPVARSKLHGHRGVGAYDPRFVEFVRLDAPYYHYPVSCATEAQSRAIKAALARSEALRHPADPRQVVFTVLPGHGVVIVEKWVAGKAPFEVMWEFMDVGRLQISNFIPQGLMDYAPDSRDTNRMALDARL
ncbi:MAG: hypothetical protein FJ030_17770 [Chloroflexi bacterium]|nr:hypothetical protein [Chloroflexota bacterium]